MYFLLFTATNLSKCPKLHDFLVFKVKTVTLINFHDNYISLVSFITAPRVNCSLVVSHFVIFSYTTVTLELLPLL